MYLVLIEVVSTSNMVYKPIILNAKLTKKIQFVIALIKEITVGRLTLHPKYRKGQLTAPRKSSAIWPRGRDLTRLCQPRTGSGTYPMMLRPAD